MEFRLLGPVQIWSGGDQVSLKRRQERLLLEPGKAVSTERLMELLWPDAMPTNPGRALQVYVSRLRTMLDVELTNGRDGYAIQALPAAPTSKTADGRARSLAWTRAGRRHNRGPL